MAIKFQGFTGGGGAATGGLTYKGTFNATAGTPDISNALQGDLYVIDVAGTIYGQTWAINDHLLVNADMGGVISNSKIDKVDNTSDTALQIGSNLSDLGNLATAQTNLNLKTAAYEDVGTTAGDVVQLDGTAKLPAVDGSQLTNLPTAPVTSVNTFTGPVVLDSSNIAENTNLYYTDARVDTEVGTLPLSTLSDASYTAGPGIDGDVLTWVNASSEWQAVTPTTAPVTSVNTQTGPVVLDTSNIAENTNLYYTDARVDTEVGTLPLSTLNDVSYTAGPGIDGDVLTWVNASSEWQAATPATAPVTSVNTFTGPVVLDSSNIAENTNLYYTDARVDTEVSTLPLSTLSDVSYTAGPGIDGDVLTWVNASSEWQAATPATAPVTSVNGQTGPVYIYADDTTLNIDGTALVLSGTGATSTLNVDVGTTASKIIQLDGAAKIPAVDGSQLTNLPFTGLDVFTTSSNPVTATINRAYWITTLGATSVTVNLPLGSTINDGDTLVVTRIRAGELVIAQNSGDAGTLVNYGTTQAASVTIQNNYQMLTIRWNGSKWYIFDQATGTAANEDTGTAVGDIPILIDVGGGVAGFSAIDGSNLTGLPSGGLAAVVDDTTPQLGGSLDVNGQSIVSVSNGDIDIAPDGTGVIKTTGSIEPDADLTRTIGTESLRYLTSHTDINGAIRFKAKNDSGGLMTKGQVVYIKGISGSVPTVDLARSNSASTMPAFGLVHANANDQAEVTIITLGNLNDVNTTTYSLSVGDTVYVSSATAGALTNSAPTTEANLIQNIGKVVRADASAGIIKVGGAGRSAATPNLDNDKIFLGNGSGQAVSTLLSAVNLTSLNQDLTTSTVTEGTNEYFTTARVDTQVATLPMSTLSDVAYTAGAGIDNYVLTYDHSSTSWGAEAAAGGGARPTVTALTSTPYTIGTTDSAIGASELERAYLCSASAATVNLPTAVGLSGLKLQIKNLLATTITIDPNGTEQIDLGGAGVAYSLSAQYSNITLMSDNSNWYIV